MSDFDSESISLSDPFSFIEEPSDDSLTSEDTFPLSFIGGWDSSDDIFKLSDDSLSEDIFPLAYSEEEQKPVFYSHKNLNMATEIVVEDDDVVINKESKRKANNTTSGKDKKSSIFIPDGDYGDDIIFVEPENYSPRKKMKLDEEKRTAAIDKSSLETDSDIAVTFAKKGIDFPHAREHCRVKKFVQVPSLTTKNPGNEEFCDKCYCYVCDDLASKCESWKKGEEPHCNAYAKHAFWEKERRLHKRNMKKFEFVPIITLLPPGKINQEMARTGIAGLCNSLVDQIQEVSDASYDMPTRNMCGCYCHEGIFLNYSGCGICHWEHNSLQYNVSNLRAMNKFTLKVIVSNSMVMVENNLKRNQPNSAIAILDTITSLLLGVDINSTSAVYMTEMISSRLTSLWIEAALNKDVDQDLLSLAKERLGKSLKDNSSKIFLSEAKVIHKVLSELRPYKDPLVVKCLTKKHSGSSGLKEPYEVTKVRLQYLKSNNKISEAINYILGAETDVLNCCCTNRLCDFPHQRNELINLLIQNGRIQEALTVCKTHQSSKLPTSLGKTPTGKSFKMHSTPLKFMSPKTFKNLFLGLVKPKTAKNATAKGPSNISEEGLRNALALTFPGIYINGELDSLDFFEFLLGEISAQNKNYKYTSASVRKDVQKSASTFLDTKVQKGRNHFQPEDIKPPRNVPLQVYAIEILVTIMSARFSFLKCLQCLVKKELYWVCESLITLPQLQDKISPSEVSYVTKSVLPKIDCSTIPVEVFQKWFTNINAAFNFYILFNLVCDIFDAGDKMKGAEGIGLKKKGMILSQTLMESLLIHSYGQERSAVVAHLQTVQKKFSSEVAKKLGLTIRTWGPLEIEFVFKPSFQALEAIRKSMSSQNREEFLKKQAILLKFLKKNSRFLQEVVIEILIQREMYKDLLECLSGLTGVYNGYESSFSKINTSLEEVKRKGDKSKTMALVEALKDYVATALVQASFSYSFRHATNPIPSQVSECAKLIHSISKVLFLSIIKKAIDDVTQKYLRNTVCQQKRTELGRWLLEIKAIFTSVKENEVWSSILVGILQGPLRRKQQIISCLRWTPNLH